MNEINQNTTLHQDYDVPRLKGWEFFFSAIVIGLVLPFITLFWAQVIGGDLIFDRNFPDLVLMGFNFISFFALSLTGLFVLRRPAIDQNIQFVRKIAITGATLGVLGLSIHLHMSYWISTSSTTGLIFIFYLPYIAFSIVVGYGFGWVIGETETKLHERNRRGFLYGVNSMLFILYFAFNIYASNFGKFNLPATPGIVVREPLGTIGKKVSFQKETFFDAPDNLGAITSIDLKKCNPNINANITITGRGGAAFVTKSGTLEFFIKFKKVAGFDVFPVDIENDGFCEFVDNAGGWSPVGLIDHKGNHLWVYGKSISSVKDEILIEAAASPQDIIAFDVGGDGELDFLIPLLIVGRDETHVLSKSGDVLQKLDYDLEGSKTADIDNDGDDELISLVLSRDALNRVHYEIVVRDTKLQIVNRFSVSCTSNLCTLRVVKWPDIYGTWHALINLKNTVQIIDLENGNVTEEFKAEAGYSGEIIPVRFIANRDQFLVTVNSSNRRITLSIYDSDKNLVYEEILRGGVTLMVLPNDIDGGETLLASECGRELDGSLLCGKVWQYRLRGF